ncbi:MAG TPA: YcaO-like family protein [Microlunatus sp.]|nr:YcaO-like family protein [Microlunatus sp.]
MSLAEASARAVGEALERYCALTAVVEPVTAKLRDSIFRDAWPRCNVDEGAPTPFTTPPLDAALSSVRLRRLSDDTEHSVPVGHVLLRHVPAHPEPPVTIPISTGLAFHPDLVKAIWAGLCEVVERDAVMSFWWIHEPRPRIDLRDAPHSLIERASRLSVRHMAAYLFDVTTELDIPTVFCVLTSPTYPRLVVGAAAKASAEEACAKALDEVVAMRVALRAQPERRRDDMPVTPPHTLIDHALYYASDPEHSAFQDILLTAGSQPFRAFARRTMSQPSGMGDLRRVAARLEAQGATTLWTDLTTAEVRAAGRVVKVVIPELLPLSPRDDVRWLATPALQRRVKAAGKAQFTAHPHPFA